MFADIIGFIVKETQVITNLLVLIAIIAIPIIVFHLQKSKDIYLGKFDLFSVLMSYRKNDLYEPAFLHALNLVEIVFHSHSSIVRKFHEAQKLYLDTSSSSNERANKFVDMMSEIASTLGFCKLTHNHIHDVLYAKDISDDPEVRAGNKEPY